MGRQILEFLTVSILAIAALPAQAQNPPAARARPTLFIQCQLVYSIDCETLRRAYFGRLTVVDRVDDESAQVRVKLTDENTTNGVVVHGKWSSGSVVDEKLEDRRLLPNFDSARIEAELITMITQAIVKVIHVDVGTGLVELVIRSVQGDPSNPSAPEKISPYYVEVGLSGSASKSGIGAVNLDGTPGPATSSAFANGVVSFYRTTAKTRLSASFSGNYSNNTQPGPDGSLIGADNFARTANLAGIYSIDGKSKWNVALIANQRADPGANVQNAGKVTAGVEYNLVPFRIEQTFEFRVKGAVSYNRDRLVMANDRGMTREQYCMLGAQIYGFWLLLKDKVSLTGAVGGNSLLNRKGYGSMSVVGVFNYQIKSGIMFSTSANYAYAKKNIDFPGVPDFSNPLATRYLSGYAGGSYNFSMGVIFRIGKGGQLLMRDRRFNWPL